MLEIKLNPSSVFLIILVINPWAFKILILHKDQRPIPLAKVDLECYLCPAFIHKTSSIFDPGSALSYIALQKSHPTF